MLIPRISFDPAAALDFGEPGSELRSLFLFGDVYLELSAEVHPLWLLASSRRLTSNLAVSARDMQMREVIAYAV
jgi:hypothetical protein